MGFLKQNWAWIVVPILLLAVVVAVIVMMGDGAVDNQTYPMR